MSIFKIAGGVALGTLFVAFLGLAALVAFTWFLELRVGAALEEQERAAAEAEAALVVSPADCAAIEVGMGLDAVRTIIGSDGAKVAEFGADGVAESVQYRWSNADGSGLDVWVGAADEAVTMAVPDGMGCALEPFPITDPVLSSR